MDKKNIAEKVQELLAMYQKEVNLYRQLADQCLYALEGEMTPDKKERLIAALRGLKGETK